MKNRRSLLTCRRGQGLTEYIIVVALVAVAAIGVVNVMGRQMRNQFATIVAALGGHSVGVEDVTEQANDKAENRTLQDYAAKNK